MLLYHTSLFRGTSRFDLPAKQRSQPFHPLEGKPSQNQHRQRDLDNDESYRF
jgi:hypothetical protein